jgi:acetylornithine deacetylase/succinyl-diaminopimelate desuccinylase-like protein
MSYRLVEEGVFMRVLMSISSCAVFALLAIATGVQAQTRIDTITETYVREHSGNVLDEFSELLRIPNGASDLPNIQRNAEWIRRAFEARGAQMELLEIDGVPPVVYGNLFAEGATRTLGLYVHYDGQPVDDSQWNQSPWQPTLYTRALEEGGKPRSLPRNGEAIDPEWRLMARSVSDDKAPLMTILTALDALQASGTPLRSNLRFLFEGEEEAGSKHLGEYLDRHRDKLDADVWLICDGPAHQSRRPQLVFGVRGYTGLDITLYGANRHLHSGHYGNWAPNPGMRLAHLLASMKKDDGDVVIAGFYDSVAPIEPAVHEAAGTIPPFEDDMRREMGLAHSEADDAPYLERMLLPSLNVRGLGSATVGETARNVVPPTATASIDMRLVKGNNPEHMLDLVEAHIRAQGYFVVHRDPTPEERLAHDRIARVDRRPGYRAVRTAMDLDITRWVIAQTRAAAGEELVLMPTLGGSLPLYLFEDKLERPLVIVPVVNHDNNQHGPNENLRLGNLLYGVRLMASYFAAE